MNQALAAAVMAFMGDPEPAAARIVGETVTGFRAVSTAELEDIATNGLRPNPNGTSNNVKWFWETLDAAKQFMSKYADLEHVIEVDVPKTVYDAAHQVNKLDHIGNAFGVPPELLSKVKPKG